MRGALIVAALAIAATTATAQAGDTMDAAIVALASVSICPVPHFTENEADSLIVLAAQVEHLPTLAAFTFAAEVADALKVEVRNRGTSVPFCNVVRKISEAMPNT